MRGRRIARTVVVLGALGLALLAPSTAAGVTASTQQYLSRPELTPPTLDIRTQAAPGVAPGYLFFSPKGNTTQTGPVIMDNSGQLIWSSAGKYPNATDFRVQTYQGNPVLTFWVGKIGVGRGFGKYVILDQHYNEIATVRPRLGIQGDLHEFKLTPDGHALVVAYKPRQVDLRSVGGPQSGWIVDGIFQDIDLTTGKLIYTWRSYDHAPVTESYYPRGITGTQSAPWDYFHINAVDKAANGDWLVSGRHTQMLYRVNGSSGANRGKLVYRIGGKRSNFAMGTGTAFNWQHDARFLDNDTISLFDNADDDPATPPNRAPSRAEIVDLNTTAKTATLVASYPSPQNLVSQTQGNAQVIGSGTDRHVLVGWGAQPWITEFAADGTVLFDATFGPGPDSYRAYRAVWHATPLSKPDVAAAVNDGDLQLAMSWNGATEVADWRVLTGDSSDSLTPVATASRNGFETTVTVPEKDFVQVQALDSTGTVIGTSDVITPQ